MSNLILIFLMVINFWSWKCLAISETNYKQNYAEKVWPYFLQNSYSNFFKGEKELLIHYRILQSTESNSKCIVVLPGRQEPVEKYAEVIFDLKNSSIGKDLSFFLIDHRGQGQSQRMTKNFQIGHVDQFQYYVKDVETFIEKIVKKNNCSKGLYLLAHSMGGAIGLGLIIKKPSLFKAAIFTSPMWKINTNPYPYFIAQSIAHMGRLLGKKHYALGQRDLDTEQPFEKTTSTHSEVRYSMANDIYKTMPETKVGGVSYGWLTQSMKYTKSLRHQGKNLLLPIYLFVSGEDTYVNPAAEKKLCQKNAQCQLQFFSQAHHELLMENDTVRDVVMNNIQNILK